MSITNAFNRIKREAGIKRCIIVEGNVSDIYLIDRELMEIKGSLNIMLGECGYTDIVTWDRIAGIQGDVKSLVLTEEPEQQDGDDYDLGDVEIPETTARGA